MREQKASRARTAPEIAGLLSALRLSDGDLLARADPDHDRYHGHDHDANKERTATAGRRADGPTSSSSSSSSSALAAFALAAASAGEFHQVEEEQERGLGGYARLPDESQAGKARYVELLLLRHGVALQSGRANQEQWHL